MFLGLNFEDEGGTEHLICYINTWGLWKLIFVLADWNFNTVNCNCVIYLPASTMGFIEDSIFVTNPFQRHDALFNYDFES